VFLEICNQNYQNPFLHIKIYQKLKGLDFVFQIKCKIREDMLYVSEWFENIS